MQCDSRCDFGVVVERAYHNFLEGVPSPKRVWFLVLFWWSFWCGFRHLKLINPINLGAYGYALTRSSCLRCVSTCLWLWSTPPPPLPTWRSSPPYPVLSPSPRRCRPSRNLRHECQTPSLDSHSLLLAPGIHSSPTWLPSPSISSPASPNYQNQHRLGPRPCISSQAGHRARAPWHLPASKQEHREYFLLNDCRSLIHLTSHVMHFW